MRGRTAGGTAVARRVRLVTAGTVVAAALLSGCTTGGAGAGEVVTIRFNQNKFQVSGYFDEMIARFETEHPNIRVVQEQNADAFIPGLVRGAPADIKSSGWAFGEGDLAKKEVFEDLSDTMAAGTIQPEVRDMLTEWGVAEEGGLPALPFSLAAAGVIYNKDLFEEHGVEVPTTWDEFVAACETFREADVTPIYGTYRENWALAQGVFDYTTGGLLDVPALYEQLKDEGAELTADSDASFENTLGPLMPKIDFVLDQAQPGANAKAYPDGNVAFAQGEAAMYLQGPWSLSEIANIDPETEVGSFPLPMTNDPADTKVRVNIDIAMGIPRDAAHPEEARTFIEWLFEEENINAFNADNGAFAPIADAEPPADDRIAGLVPYVEESRFYQGLSQYTNNAGSFALFQAYVFDRDTDGFLREFTDRYRQWAWSQHQRGLD